MPWQPMITLHAERAAVFYGLQTTELISSSTLAAQTLAQIAEIERRIASLVELRAGLKRVFTNVSRGTGPDAPERNPASSRRAMMEHVILEIF